MTDLSQFDIEEIVEVLGGALVANATRSQPQMPAYWTTSLARPTYAQEVSLKIIKNFMDRLASLPDAADVHQWFATHIDELGMNPAEAIRAGRIDETRAIVERLERDSTRRSHSSRE